MMVSQEELLEYIRANPGCDTGEIKAVFIPYRQTGSVYHQLHQLMKYGLIRMEYVCGAEQIQRCNQPLVCTWYPVAE